MLRRARYVILTIFLITTTILVVRFGIAFGQNMIAPGLQQVEVTQWNYQQNKAQINHKIQEYALKHDLKLMAGRQFESQNKTSWLIHDFGDKKKLNTYLKHPNFKYISNEDFQTKDIKGMYFLEGTLADAIDFCRYLKPLGVTAKPLKLSMIQLFKENGINQTQIFSLVSLLGLLLILLCFEKVTTYKEVAILTLNGISKQQIIWSEFKKSLKNIFLILLIIQIVVAIYLSGIVSWTGLLLCLIFNMSFLISVCIAYWLVDAASYLILLTFDLSTALKGKAPYNALLISCMLLKFLLISLIAINLVSLGELMAKHQQDTEIMQTWKSQGQGYVLNISPANRTDQQDTKLARKLHQLILKLGNDVVVARNNNLYHPNINDSDIVNGNVMIANQTFALQTSPLNFKKHANNADMLVLYPKKRSSQLPHVKKNLINWWDFQKKEPSVLSQSENLQIDSRMYQTDGAIFNYSIGETLADSMSKDPIIIVMDQTLASDDFYYATISQGMVHFKNLKRLKKEVQALGIMGDISGITDAQSQIQQFNVALLERKQHIGTILLITITQLFLITLFLLLNYIQKYNKQLAIYWLHGISVRGIIGRYLIVNICLSVLSFGLCYIYSSQPAVLIGLFGLLVSEVAMTSIVVIQQKRRLIKSLNNVN